MPRWRRSSAFPPIAPFPYIEKRLRDPSGSEALRAENLMCRAVRAIKKAVPDIGVHHSTWRSIPTPATATTA